MLHPDGIAVYIKSSDGGKPFVEYVLPGHEKQLGAEVMECFIDASAHQKYSIVINFNEKLSRTSLNSARVPGMNISRRVDEVGAGQDRFVDGGSIAARRMVEFERELHKEGKEMRHKAYGFADLSKADATSNDAVDKFLPEVGKIYVQVQPSYMEPRSFQNSKQRVLPIGNTPLRFIFKYRSTEQLQKLGAVPSKVPIGDKKRLTIHPRRNINGAPSGAPPLKTEAKDKVITQSDAPQSNAAGISPRKRKRLQTGEVLRRDSFSKESLPKESMATKSVLKESVRKDPVPIKSVPRTQQKKEVAARNIAPIPLPAVLAPSIDNTRTSDARPTSSVPAEKVACCRCKVEYPAKQYIRDVTEQVDYKVCSGCRIKEHRKALDIAVATNNSARPGASTAGWLQHQVGTQQVRSSLAATGRRRHTLADSNLPRAQAIRNEETVQRTERRSTMTATGLDSNAAAVGDRTIVANEGGSALANYADIEDTNEDDLLAQIHLADLEAKHLSAQLKKAQLLEQLKNHRRR